MDVYKIELIVDVRDVLEAEDLAEIVAEYGKQYGNVVRHYITHIASGSPVDLPDTAVWDVVLVSSDSGKLIQTIKEVRSISHMGLKEAKDLVDKIRGPQGHPQTVLRGVSHDEAARAATYLESAGAAVSVDRTHVTPEERERAIRGLGETYRELKQ